MSAFCIIQITVSKAVGHHGKYVYNLVYNPIQFAFAHSEVLQVFHTAMLITLIFPTPSENVHLITPHSHPAGFKVHCLVGAELKHDLFFLSKVMAEVRTTYIKKVLETSK